MNRVILVFLKFPEPGSVKTRLAAEIGNADASIAYRKMVCRVFEQCRIANPDRIAIAFDPVEREDDVRTWLAPWIAAFPGEISWIAQQSGDLGERLHHATEAVFEIDPESKVAIIGTDCVGLDHEIFENTWENLTGGKETVFGPTEDGGYYLLGLTKSHPELFREIPWSSSETLRASRRAASEAGLNVHLLEERIDVDTAAEWQSVEAGISNRKCVFFDRDGVINRSPGSGYVLRADDFLLNPGIADALSWLKRRDWLAIVITSQKGVGKELMSQADLDLIHQKMQRELAAAGAAFDGIFAYTGTADCPHLPKPDPEMIFSAAESFFIDLRQSWMIGDADRDIEMGAAAKLSGTIRIRGEKPIGVPADHILDEITEIANIFGKIL